MLDVFYSEFLIHPAPIEFSGNTCSHNCGYCFSNIRKPVRYADMKQTMRILNGKTKSEGLLNFLYQKGYAVCLSNRTDPFSVSNAPHTLAVLKVLARAPNGIFFQTKGGAGVDDAFMILEGKRNVVFYITVTTLDEAMASRMEPGAPAPEERLALAERAKRAGYEVVLAVNPCVEAWMPHRDLEWLEDWAVARGIRHFIFQKLKLNGADVKAFTPYRLGQFSEAVLDMAVKGRDAWFQSQVERQIEKGLLPVAFGMPFRTRFFDDIDRCLGKTMRGNYAFFDQCFEAGEGLVFFDDYCRAILGPNPDLDEFCGKALQKYIVNQHRGVWRDSEAAKMARTFRDVLRVFWNNARMGGSPQNNFLFQSTGRPDESGDVVLYFAGGKVCRDQRRREGGE
jgi:DNA repair photolyase